jgi:predicted DNA-binding transcriptional regulator AlpA
MTTPSITDDRLLNKVETAEAMRVSVWTVDKWVQHGTGPKFLKVGVRVYFRESELNRWIAQRTHVSTHRKAEQVTA